MPDLFGAVAGSRQADLDAQTKMLQNLTAQKDEISIAQSGIALQQQMKMLQMMQQGGQGQDQGQGNPSQDTANPTTALATRLEQLSGMAAQSGLLDKSEALARISSQLRQSSALVEKEKTETLIKNLNVYSSLLQGVNNDQTWQHANNRYQMETGQPSPYSKLPYNPELVGKLQMGVQSAKDRALTQAAQAREKASEATTSERNARLPLIQAQTRLANDRSAALEKVGIAPPKADQVKVITDLITKDFGDPMTAADYRNPARPIAERMVELIHSDGLTQTEAAGRAYSEAKSRGDLAGLRPRMEMKGTFKNPIDVPDPTKLDKASLKVNTVYKFGSGPYARKMLIWTGTGFKEVKPPSE